MWPFSLPKFLISSKNCKIFAPNGALILIYSSFEIEKCIDFPRSLCSLAYIWWSRYGYFVGQLVRRLYSAVSWVIIGKLNWMYRCNKVTEKHVILFVSFNSNIERWGVLVLMNAKKFPSSLALLARWHADFHDIGFFFGSSLSVSGSFNYTSIRYAIYIKCKCIVLQI